MSERDIRVVENITRTGISFEDLCDYLYSFRMRILR